MLVWVGRDFSKSLKSHHGFSGTDARVKSEQNFRAPLVRLGQLGTTRGRDLEAQSVVFEKGFGSYENYFKSFFGKHASQQVPKNGPSPNEETSVGWGRSAGYA